ncbi:hypothetical protein AB4K20DRAFT_1356281 [Rhizopus microsporus]
MQLSSTFFQLHAVFFFILLSYYSCNNHSKARHHAHTGHASVLFNKENLLSRAYKHLPRRYCEPISSIRTKIRSLRIDNPCILDVFYPTRCVVGILFHNNYIPTVLDILTKAGITLLSDFNPRDEANLCDPKHAQLPPDGRAAMVTTIHTTHLFRTLKHMRSDVYSAILRAFIE